MGNDIIVIGSINMDIVVRTKEIPKVGETVIGREIIENPGGKGANQAVALGKLGTKVGFLGMVGSDAYGKKLLLSMKESGVDTSLIKSVEGSSGTAFISVDDLGNNSIIVIPGANHMVDKEYLNENVNAIKESKIVLLQHEIPMESVKKAILISKSLGKTVVLNPAPACDLEEEIIRNIDILIPNEHELARISNRDITDIDSVVEASRYLINIGVPRIITTLGEKGVLYVDENIVQHFKPFPVNVVDTTAAGDSFIGGFLHCYIETNDIFKSIEFGQKVAAFTIQRYGAQVSLPTLKEMNSFVLDGENEGIR